MTAQDELILQAHAELQGEFAEVYRLLTSVTDDLQTPLSDLVRSQLQRTLSPRRASVILAAGVGESDSLRLREQRILVAAALELLALALYIHQLLPDSDASDKEEAMQKSRVGSVVLAGDYCFSRSAMLAAETDNPQVVERIARSLKAISENNLRHLFQDELVSADDTHILVQAGLASASLLAAHDPQRMSIVSDLGHRLLHQVATTDAHTDAHIDSLIERLPAAQQGRWQALLTWQPLLPDLAQDR